MFKPALLVCMYPYPLLLYYQTVQPGNNEQKELQDVKRVRHQGRGSNAHKK